MPPPPTTPDPDQVRSTALQKSRLGQLSYQRSGAVSLQAAAIRLPEQVYQFRVACAGAAASVQILEYGSGDSIAGRERRKIV